MLNSWFSACATPEKWRPAVPFRKQLFECRDVEPAPSVWINVSPVRSPGSVNAAEVKEHAGQKQRGALSLGPGFLLGLVQVAGLRSESERWKVVPKKKKQQHRMSFQNTQRVSGHGCSHVALTMGTCLASRARLNQPCVSG